MNVASGTIERSPPDRRPPAARDRRPRAGPGRRPLVDRPLSASVGRDPRRCRARLAVGRGRPAVAVHGGAHDPLPANTATAPASRAPAASAGAAPHVRQVAGGDDRVRRQAVDLRLVEQQEERAGAADAVVGVLAVQPRVHHPRRVQRSDPGVARSRSSSTSPNWIDWVGQACAQAGVWPAPSRS